MDCAGCRTDSLMKTRCDLRQAGFTLVEIMIVVAIIGLLLALAIPSFQKARERALIARFINDARVAAGAFEMYTLEQRGYPPNVAQGVVPPGMGPYLGRFPWTQPTPLGGQWNWDSDVHGYKAGVAVCGSSFPLEVFQKIDRTIDDGDLSTGMFRERPNGYTYVIEP
jgi:prepilin-type N-terminal cleavage/methylation domain-containing protein